MKKITLHSLVICTGPSSNDMQHLAEFPPHEVLSATKISNELVGENRSEINSVVFNEVHRRAALKLGLGERVVIDAPNLRREDRVSLAHIGIQAGVPVFYLVHDGDDDRELQMFRSAERDILRGDGVAEVIDTRFTKFTPVAKLPSGDIAGLLRRQGYRGITVVGDVHGMYHAMHSAISWAKSRNHFLLFLGDVLDYGRQTLDAVDEVYRLVMRGEAELIIGNHERKILRWIDQSDNGRVTLTLSEGNRVTTKAIEALSPNERRRWISRFRGLMALSRHHRRIDNVLLVHAAAQPEMWSATDRRLPRPLEAYAIFGEIDRVAPMKSDGTPNRQHRWVEQVSAGSLVIVGHEIRSTLTPVTQSNKNGGKAIFLDTGSGKGGQLSTADLVFSDNGLHLSCFVQH